MKNRNEDFKNTLAIEYSALIENENEKNKKRYMILFSIILITLIITITSLILSIVSFSHTKEINDSTKTQGSSYKTLEVVYNQDQFINIERVQDKKEIPSKIITVKNTGTTATNFDIKINSIKTSVITNNVLSYTLVQNDITNSEKNIPLSETTIVKNLVINPDSTMTFKLDINYKEGINSEINDYYFANVIVEQSSDEILKEH